jgi:hypothetical protein
MDADWPTDVPEGQKENLVTELHRTPLLMQSLLSTRSDYH